MRYTPITRLATRRLVDRPDLPQDLRDFYALNEGVGFDASPDYPLRISRLEKVRETGIRGLGGTAPAAWASFSALVVGLGTCGEQITYVLDAPSAPRGSILAFGDHCIGWGGGGTGPDTLEGSLVLAPSWCAWLAHIERWGWEDPVITGVGDRTIEEQRELRQYYLRWNPEIDWPAE